MPKPTSVRTCRCITLHTYAAYVTADDWHTVIHICHCGREHLNDALLPPLPTAAPRKSRRKRRAPG